MLRNITHFLSSIALSSLETTIKARLYDVDISQSAASQWRSVAALMSLEPLAPDWALVMAEAVQAPPRASASVSAVTSQCWSVYFDPGPETAETGGGREQLDKRNLHRST